MSVESDLHKLPMNWGLFKYPNCGLLEYPTERFALHAASEGQSAGNVKHELGSSDFTETKLEKKCGSWPKAHSIWMFADEQPRREDDGKAPYR